MIEEYIHKGYVPINKDTIITWLKESIDFSTSLLKYEAIKNDASFKQRLDTKKRILATLETGLKYEDFTPYILDKLKLCESNRNYFNSINKSSDYWVINIKLYNYLQQLLDQINDGFIENQNGQLQLF